MTLLTITTKTTTTTTTTTILGTGKSYILRVLQDVLDSLGLLEKIAFTAPTGVAACNVRGLTIHAWAGIGRCKYMRSAQNIHFRNIEIFLRNNGNFCCRKSLLIFFRFGSLTIIFVVLNFINFFDLFYDYGNLLYGNLFYGNYCRHGSKG